MNSRRLLSAIIACVLFSTAATAQSPAPAMIPGVYSPSGVVASVSVNTSGSGLTIPAGFVGLSSEVGDFTAGFYQGTSGQWTSNGYTGNAASFKGLMNLLGPCVPMRIGGGSADTGTAPNITTGMASNLNAFLVGLGGPSASCPLIYSLDFIANDAAAAATTATNIAAAVGVTKVVFQFGNEPSINGFTASQYETRWNSYYTAVHAAVSTALYGAIDDIQNTGFGNPITVANALTPTLSGLSFLSQHWYSFCNGVWPSPSPAILLGSIFSNQRGATLAGPGYFSGANQGAGYFLSNGKTGSVAQRMSETNTICARGQAGMSDRMMASTWFLDMAILLASNGWVGMNVHNVWEGGLGAYNASVIQPDHNFAPGGIFPGMLLFSKIEGQQILPSSVGGSQSVSAIATKGANGNANIIVVNNSVSQNALVTPQQSGAWTTATVLLMKDGIGLGCSDPSPIVGGQPIGESGAWSGASFSITNGQSIMIPPCGSPLIEIQP